MAQNNLKHAPTVNAFSTTLNGAISDTDTTITLNSVTGLQNKAGILVIDRQDASGNDTPTKREYIYFTSVAGSAVVCPDATDGRGQGGSTAQSHADGAKVEAVMDVDQWNGLVTSYDVQHTDAGAHESITSTTLGLSSNASIAGNVFGNTLKIASTASICGRLDAENLNLPSTASGYYQAGVPVIGLGADKFLRLSQIRYQNDNADTPASSTVENVVIQTGWAQQVGSGATNMNITVTFPTAFTSILNVIPGAIGMKATSAAANITELVSLGDFSVEAQDISTTGCTLSVKMADNADNLNASNYYGVSWIAIGT